MKFLEFERVETFKSSTVKNTRYTYTIVVLMVKLN